MGDFNTRTEKLIYTSLFIGITTFMIMISMQFVGQLVSTALMSNASKSDSSFFSNVLGEGLAFVVVVVVGSFFLELKRSFWVKNIFKALLLMAPMLIVIYLNGSQYLLTIAKSGFVQTSLLKGLLIGVLVGLFEEYAYRKTVITYLIRENKKTSYLTIAFVSGFIFSLVHFINLFTSSMENTLLQMMYAFGIGSLFAAVFLRTRNILIPVIFHALTDAFSFAANPAKNLSTGDSGVSLNSWVLFGLITVVFVAFTILYLRKKFTQQISELWN